MGGSLSTNSVHLFNNSYHSSIQMTLFDALYGRRCRSPIICYEVGETQFFIPNPVRQVMEKVRIIRESLKTTQCHPKSYVDVRIMELEFEIDNWVLLKVSFMKGDIRFGRKKNSFLVL